MTGRVRRKRGPAFRLNTDEIAAEVRRERRRLRLLPSSDVDALAPLPPRPKTRGDCVGGVRPCPYVSCKHHLHVDVLPNGALSFTHDGDVGAGMRDTCALDVADRGPSTLEDVGVRLGVTRERVRQIEKKAKSKMLAHDKKNGGTLADGLEALSEFLSRGDAQEDGH